MLELPVVLLNRAATPIATLRKPVVLNLRLLEPKAVFRVPVVFDWPVFTPNKVFVNPVPPERVSRPMVPLEFRTICAADEIVTCFMETLSTVPVHVASGVTASEPMDQLVPVQLPVSEEKSRSAVAEIISDPSVAVELTPVMSKRAVGELVPMPMLPVAC